MLTPRLTANSLHPGHPCAALCCPQHPLGPVSPAAGGGHPDRRGPDDSAVDFQMDLVPRYDFVDGKFVSCGSAFAPTAHNPAYRDAKYEGFPQKQVLVKRNGFYHLVDPDTKCATLTMGKKEARKILGKLKPQVFPHAIHTMLGTLP